MKSIKFVWKHTVHKAFIMCKQDKDIFVFMNKIAFKILGHKSPSIKNSCCNPSMQSEEALKKKPKSFSVAFVCCWENAIGNTNRPDRLHLSLRLLPSPSPRWFKVSLLLFQHCQTQFQSFSSARSSYLSLLTLACHAAAGKRSQEELAVIGALSSCQCIVLNFPSKAPLLAQHWQARLLKKPINLLIKGAHLKCTVRSYYVFTEIKTGDANKLPYAVIFCHPWETNGHVAKWRAVPLSQKLSQCATSGSKMLIVKANWVKGFRPINQTSCLDCMCPYKGWLTRCIWIVQAYGGSKTDLVAS